MGNGGIDPKCKAIFDRYQDCYKDWKDNTDWRQWRHEGTNEACNELLNEFQFCCKEQVSYITNIEPIEITKIKKEVELEQKLSNSSTKNS